MVAVTSSGYHNRMSDGHRHPMTSDALELVKLERYHPFDVLSGLTRHRASDPREVGRFYG